MENSVTSILPLDPLGAEFGKGMRRSKNQQKEKRIVAEWGQGIQWMKALVGFLQDRQFSEEVAAIQWTVGPS